MEDNMKNLKAFTLAEVLIVLGIIGVISAMTLPTLISNYQKQVLVNQLRKSHSLLSQAFERMMHEEKAVNFNETDFWSICLRGNNSSQCQGILSKYLKSTNAEYVSSSGRAYNTLSCSWSSSNGGEYSSCSKSNNTRSDYTRGNTVSLPDGSTVYFNGSAITIDVNGSQKPNTYGRDLFTFDISSQTGELSPWYDEFGGPGARQIIKDGWEMNY